MIIVVARREWTDVISYYNERWAATDRCVATRRQLNSRRRTHSARCDHAAGAVGILNYGGWLSASTAAENDMLRETR